LFCGCLAHPHCMFEAVFSQDARCRRCERGMTGGWLGQWGFDLDSKAAVELRLTEEILLAEPASPRAGSKRPAAPSVAALPWKKAKGDQGLWPLNLSTHFLLPALLLHPNFSSFLTLVCCQQLQRMLSPTQTPWRSIPRNALLRRPRQPYLEMGTRTHPPPRKDHLKQRRTRTTPTWRDCRALLRQLPQTQTWSRFPPWIVL